MEEGRVKQGRPCCCRHARLTGYIEPSLELLTPLSLRLLPALKRSEVRCYTPEESGCFQEIEKTRVISKYVIAIEGSMAPQLGAESRPVDLCGAEGVP